MMKTNCNTTRRELDEINLGEEGSTSTMLHLQQCLECQEFYQSRTKLRQLVGSLETVEAPADFDFRLRARLAGEKTQSARLGMFANWPAAFRVVAAAAIVLMVGAIVFLSQRRSHQPSVAKVQVEEPGRTEAVTPKSTEVLAPASPELATGSTTAPAIKKQKAFPNTTLAGINGKRQMTTAEFSSESAPRFRREESIAGVSSTVFPIGPANQSLKVSLDDGTGNWRTISLPTVSFGSQRVVASGSVSNQLAAKGIW